MKCMFNNVLGEGLTHLSVKQDTDLSNVPPLVPDWERNADARAHLGAIGNNGWKPLSQRMV